MKKRAISYQVLILLLAMFAVAACGKAKSQNKFIDLGPANKSLDTKLANEVFKQIQFCQPRMNERALSLLWLQYDQSVDHRTCVTPVWTRSAHAKLKSTGYTLAGVQPALQQLDASSLHVLLLFSYQGAFGQKMTATVSCEASAQLKLWLATNPVPKC